MMCRCATVVPRRRFQVLREGPMAYEHIIYAKDAGAATITLNRPERMNAFTDVMIREWAEALTDARLDREVRAVIVTGAGRGFCAGADLKGGMIGEQPRSDAAPSAADRRNWLRDGVHAVPRAVQLLDKPYI